MSQDKQQEYTAKIAELEANLAIYQATKQNPYQKIGEPPTSMMDMVDAQYTAEVGMAYIGSMDRVFAGPILHESEGFI